MSNKKYPAIAALVPKDEHFDESAIVNEGGYLSTKHLDAVEQKMSDDASTLEAKEERIKSLDDKVKDANDATAKVQKDLDAANATIEENKTTIATLQAEVAKLKKEPAGSPASTSTTGDKPVVETAKTKKEKYRTSFDVEAEKYAKK